MAKYRKKPTVVDAWLFNGYTIEHEGIPAWVQTNCLWKPNQQGTKGYLLITTLEGVLLVRAGDYIIKDAKGKIYPCPPDIFEATHEPIEDMDGSIK